VELILEFSRELKSAAKLKREERPPLTMETLDGMLAGVAKK
jgi:hypothetical protein